MFSLIGINVINALKIIKNTSTSSGSFLTILREIITLIPQKYALMRYYNINEYNGI